MPPNAVAFWKSFWDGLDAKAKSRGSVAGVLQLIETLKTEKFSLDIADFHTKDGSQLKNASAKRLGEILARHGERRPLLKEGGRTNRGLLPVAEKFLEALRACGANAMPKQERAAFLEATQKSAAQEAIAFLNKNKLKANLSAGVTREIARDLLAQARARNKHGAVAQYLVGAKLALVFAGDGIDIPARDASAADASEQTGGDFVINETTIHVTVAPGAALAKKCKENAAAGSRVLVLVADEKLQAAREMLADKNTAVESVETFVSVNVDEMSKFSVRRGRYKLGDLLRLYNKRVKIADTDLSLLVEIPESLQ